MQNQRPRRNQKIAKSSSEEVKRLLHWYHANKRALPWRKNRDPYSIWLSETMLQQTTTTAVIPYYEKFLAAFPTLQDLARASESEVISLWAGLGYYSRARNLLKASRELVRLGGFPRSYIELIELPGFGPYTARAVSSIAFDEPVGVLDGNVIRVLCRRHNLKAQWWQRAERQGLQDRVDELASHAPSSEVNQALMELGSQICTPQNPHCFGCPWLQSCLAKKHSTMAGLPLRKPKRKSEIWHWQARIETKNKKLRMVRNLTGPFLKGEWVLPGELLPKRQKPKNFDFRHSITHHDIFVDIKKSKPPSAIERGQESLWLPIADIFAEVPKISPSSLLRKALGLAHRNGLISMALLAITTMALATSMLLSSCRTSGVKSPAVETTSPALQVAPGLTQITSNGENYRPQISADNRRLLFISNQRSNHSQPQIYEMDIAQHREHRITYQDGTVYDAIYDPNSDHILYSSNTDEIKENPIFLRQALSRAKNSGANLAPTLSNPAPSPSSSVEIWPAFLDESFGEKFIDKLPLTDIYYGSRDGREIRRLTNTPGFEGQLSLRPKSHEVILSGIDNEKSLKILQLSRLNFQSGHLETLAPSSSDNPKNAPASTSELWPNVSPDGKKMIWSRWLSPSESELWIANLNGSRQLAQAKKLLSFSGSQILFAKWSPKGDEILFSSNHDDAHKFDLYVAKIDGGCPRRLTRDAGQNIDPIFSADLKTIYFTSDRTGRRQIYALEYNPAPCATPSAPVQ